MYHWQLKHWPDFRYEAAPLRETCDALYARSQRQLGIFEGLPKASTELLTVDSLVREALSTAAIEGEVYRPDDVRSSVLVALGLAHPDSLRGDARALAVGRLALAAQYDLDADLTDDRLHAWHALLFSAGAPHAVGAWRSSAEAMRIVSGGVGRETVHYEAPPTSCVAAEMEAFVAWYNDRLAGPLPPWEGPIFAALAHLRFETIHPYPDGNGRIGRALADRALAQVWGSPTRLSLSAAIEADRARYYAELGTAQAGLDVQRWLVYFLDLVAQAQSGYDAAVRRIRLRGELLGLPLNARQRKAVERLLRDWPAEFTGGLSATKYARLTGASKATATRDLRGLVELGALAARGEGRGRRYLLRSDRRGV